MYFTLKISFLELAKIHSISFMVYAILFFSLDLAPLQSLCFFSLAQCFMTPLILLVFLPPSLIIYEDRILKFFPICKKKKVAPEVQSSVEQTNQVNGQVAYLEGGAQIPHPPPNHPQLGHPESQQRPDEVIVQGCQNRVAYFLE